MNYEKEYKEALERARVWKEKSGMPKNKQSILDDIFPELRESESERMKKELIKFLQECHNIDSGFFSRYCEIPFAQMLAWLEKQGTSYTKRDIDDAYVEGMAFAKGELEKQKSAWSEEDDYNLQCMIAKVTSDIQKGNIGRNNELIDWLKSLKQRIGG